MFKAAAVALMLPCLRYSATTSRKNALSFFAMKSPHKKKRKEQCPPLFLNCSQFVDYSFLPAPIGRLVNCSIQNGKT
nr:MAG TPA: hypothetical protein [Caudoviricetes sp.]